MNLSNYSFLNHLSSHHTGLCLHYATINLQKEWFHSSDNIQLGYSPANLFQFASLDNPNLLVSMEFEP